MPWLIFAMCFLITFCLIYPQNIQIERCEIKSMIVLLVCVKPGQWCLGAPPHPTAAQAGSDGRLPPPSSAADAGHQMAIDQHQLEPNQPTPTYLAPTPNLSAPIKPSWPGKPAGGRGWWASDGALLVRGWRSRLSPTHERGEPTGLSTGLQRACAHEQYHFYCSIQKEGPSPINTLFKTYHLQVLQGTCFFCSFTWNTTKTLGCW